MRLIYRIPLLLIIITAALISYSIGSMAGMGILLVLGVFLEGFFWWGLFKGFRRKRV